MGASPLKTKKKLKKKKPEKQKPKKKAKRQQDKENAKKEKYVEIDAADHTVPQHDWTMYEDDKTERKYYHNSETGETTWVRPAEMLVQVPAANLDGNGVQAASECRRRRRLAHMQRRRTLMDRLHRGNVPVRN